MGEVVAVLLVVVFVAFAATVLLAATAWRWARRRNEVSWARRTRAPLHWLLWPSTCARLHRRLRDAVVVLRLAVPPPRRTRRRALSPVEALAADIELHAVMVDREVVAGARVRGAEGVRQRRRAAARVQQVERCALRLAAEQRASTLDGSVDAGLRRVEEQLDARESAWAELARLERDAGLGAPA